MIVFIAKRNDRICECANNPDEVMLEFLDTFNIFGESNEKLEYNIRKHRLKDLIILAPTDTAPPENFEIVPAWKERILDLIEELKVFDASESKESYYIAIHWGGKVNDIVAMEACDSLPKDQSITYTHYSTGYNPKLNQHVRDKNLNDIIQYAEALKKRDGINIEDISFCEVLHEIQRISIMLDNGEKVESNEFEIIHSYLDEDGLGENKLTSKISNFFNKDFSKRELIALRDRCEKRYFKGETD